MGFNSAFKELTRFQNSLVFHSLRGRNCTSSVKLLISSVKHSDSCTRTVSRTIFEWEIRPRKEFILPPWWRTCYWRGDGTCVCRHYLPTCLGKSNVRLVTCASNWYKHNCTAVPISKAEWFRVIQSSEGVNFVSLYCKAGVLTRNVLWSARRVAPYTRNWTEFAGQSPRNKRGPFLFQPSHKSIILTKNWKVAAFLGTCKSWVIVEHGAVCSHVTVRTEYFLTF